MVFLTAYLTFALTLFFLSNDWKQVWYSTAELPPYSYVWLVAYVLFILPYRTVFKA